MTRALIAATHVLTGQRIDDPKKHKREWHDEAWSFYDESGPLRYGVTWIANMISKARLTAARIQPGGDEPEPVNDGVAADAVEALAGGIGGQTQLLRSMAVQLTVPGVGYLVGSDEGETWRVLSGDAIRLASPANNGQAPTYTVQELEGQWRPLPEDSLVIKVWRPHERFPWESDSPARAALGSLRELRRIGQYIDAVLVSRLAGAGMFIYPAEAQFPTAPRPDPDQPQTQNDHPFVTEVMNVMMTAVKNPGTAAQVVPIPVQVPGEYADKFKLVTWATELSDKILAMRESALRQASISLDIPAEILTGMGDVNHWGQWQIEESAIKVHAEPLLEVISSALTEGYLHPVLEAAGEDTTDLIIWADTSELTARPDRSDDALQLYDRGELNGEALRRETGMGEGDQPLNDDLADWAWKRLLANPQLAPTALVALGIDVPEAPQVVTPGGEPAPETEVEDDEEDEDSGADRRTLPDTKDDEETEPPGNFNIDLPRLLVLEGHVKRALAVATNRRNGNSKRDLFEGTFTDATVTLGDIGFDPILTVNALETYCKALLDREGDYSRESLALVVRGLCRSCSEVAA